MAKQRCCFAAPQSSAAERFTAFRHHVIIIKIAKEARELQNNQYKSFDDLPLMLTVNNVAEVLGISRTGAYELVRRPDFPTLNIGKRIVVPKEEFARWVRENTGKLTP